MPHDNASGSDGFDFLLGDWDVRHRKLARRLADNHDWIEFSGSLHVDPILGGAANIDKNVLDDPAGPYEATSVRIYDAVTAHWSVYWIDGRAPALANPVVGRFAGPIGHFYTDDEFEGRAIRLRFIYENVDAQRARWSQAFSIDAGESWETNWTMEFRRIAETQR